MRFNPKADISRGRVGDAGGSGGGGGGPMRIPIPGGTRAGGGIGGILIIILFVVLTQCMGGGLPGGGGGTGSQGQSQGNPQGIDPNDERYANCKTGADAQNDPDGRQAQPIPDNQPPHRRRVRAERDPHADLARALRDRIRDDPV